MIRRMAAPAMVLAVPWPPELAGIASAKGTTPPDSRARPRSPSGRRWRPWRPTASTPHTGRSRWPPPSLTPALVETRAAGGIDPAIKDFAARHVPTIQGHLEPARDLLAKAREQAIAG